MDTIFHLSEAHLKMRSPDVYSHKTGRVHHLLSDLELAVFLSLEWESSMLDIREQFAIQVNPAAALQDERTLEKLDLERRYWQQKQIPWLIFCKKRQMKTLFMPVSRLILLMVWS